MNPATPEATFGVWIVKARIPAGTSDARPRPAPLGASLASSTGSPGIIGMNTPRSTASSSLVRAPAGTIARGHSAILTCSAVIVPPRGMASAAVTTGTVSAGAAPVPPLTRMFTPAAADRPKTRARATIMRVRTLTLSPPDLRRPEAAFTRRTTH